MIEELTLSEQFGLIALKNQRSSQETTAKKANLRALAAACLLEIVIEEDLDQKTNATISLHQVKTVPPYVKKVISMLTKATSIQKETIKEILGQAATLSNKQLADVEELCVAHLTEKHLIR